MTIIEYILNIALVGLVALQIRGHRITVARMLVPVVVTLWVASQVLHAVPTVGGDVLLEAVLGLAGLGLGVAAGFATSVRRDGAGAFAKAGLVAAVLWVLGIGARVAFFLWATHGGRPAIESFSVDPSHLLWGGLDLRLRPHGHGRGRQPHRRPLHPGRSFRRRDPPRRPAQHPGLGLSVGRTRSRVSGKIATWSS